MLRTKGLDVAGRLSHACGAALASATTATSLLILSEFAFFATKPSSLSGLEASGMFRALFLALVQFALLVAPIALGLALLGAGIRRFSRGATSTGGFGQVPAALVFATLALLLIDNFTYTILGFGVVHASGVARAAYAGLYATLAFFALRRWTAWAERRSLALWIGPISVVTAIAGLVLLGPEAEGDFASAPALRIDPDRVFSNVILLSGDGIPTYQTSLRARSRDTTPFLRRLAEESQLSLQHFSNAANTGGAMAALLTGRHPF